MQKEEICLWVHFGKSTKFQPNTFKVQGSFFGSNAENPNWFNKKWLKSRIRHQAAIAQLPLGGPELSAEPFARHKTLAVFAGKPKASAGLRFGKPSATSPELVPGPSFSQAAMAVLKLMTSGKEKAPDISCRNGAVAGNGGGPLSWCCRPQKTERNKR